MYQVPRELRSPGGVLERSPTCLAPSPPAPSVSCLSPLQVLFNQFKYFFNLYFLLLACSQFVPEMRLGALYTYWVPLVSQLGHPSGGSEAASVLQAAGTGRGLSRERTPPAPHAGSPRGFLVALCSAHRQGPRPRRLGSSFPLSVRCPVSPCFSKRFPPAHRGLLGTGLAHSGPEKGRASDPVACAL